MTSTQVNYSRTGPVRYDQYGNVIDTSVDVSSALVHPQFTRVI